MKSSNIIAGLLCLAGILLPFSIAGANIALGLALAGGLLSGLWWRGTLQLWQEARPFSLALLAYLALMPLGLLWSDNLPRGMVVISKQWSWLLLPLAVHALRDPLWQQRFFLAVSAGLGLHLLLCVMQAFGVPLPLDFPAGSSRQDPSGLVGHIGFGLIYGMWAAWLVHQATLNRGWQRTWQLGLAVVSIVMIFVVQGRSGYLVAIVLTCLMFWKLWLVRHRPPVWSVLLALLLLVSGLVTIAEKNNRIQSTIHSLQTFFQGDLKHSEPRLSLWYAAIEGWRQHPALGLGTGGFPYFAGQLAEHNRRLDYSGPPGAEPMHPHQQYLTALTRWGPAGLFLLLLLFWRWWRLDRQADWRMPHTALPLITGLALATHGLSAPSLEEYYGSVYGALLLGTGLTAIISIRRRSK